MAVSCTGVSSAEPAGSQLPPAIGAPASRHLRQPLELVVISSVQSQRAHLRHTRPEKA